MFEIIVSAALLLLTKAHRSRRNLELVLGVLSEKLNLNQCGEA
jgi:hypothetical protein